MAVRTFPFQGLRRQVFVILSGVLAALTATGAALCILAFSGPGGPVAGFLPLAPVDEVRAERLLDAGGHDPRRLKEADAAAMRALHQAPTHAAAWLDLAFSDAARHGGLTDAGRTDLQNSYVFEPLGPDVSAWRIRFAFEHWDALGPELRHETLYEVQTLWPIGQNEIRKQLQAVRNPSGRLAAGLLVNGVLDKRPAKS
jgi:hypothetical protein